MRERIIIYYPFHVPPMHYYAHYCSCAAGFTGTRCQFKSIPLDILYGNGPEKGINFCTYLYSYIVHRNHFIPGLYIGPPKGHQMLGVWLP